MCKSLLVFFDLNPAHLRTRLQSRGSSPPQCWWPSLGMRRRSSSDSPRSHQTQWRRQLPHLRLRRRRRRLLQLLPPHHGHQGRLGQQGGQRGTGSTRRVRWSWRSWSYARWGWARWTAPPCSRRRGSSRRWPPTRLSPSASAWVPATAPSPPRSCPRALLTRCRRSGTSCRWCRPSRCCRPPRASTSSRSRTRSPPSCWTGASNGPSQWSEGWLRPATSTSPCSRRRPWPWPTHTTPSRCAPSWSRAATRIGTQASRSRSVQFLIPS